MLSIGNQSRPRIFDLNIKKPSPLYTDVVEIDERVTLVGFTSDPYHAEHAIQFDESGNIIKGYSGNGSQNLDVLAQDGQLEDGQPEPKIVRGISGEAVHILQELDESQAKSQLQQLYDQGYRSLAVVLAHSYTYPAHELAIGRLAESVGFKHISLSSQLLPPIKMVPRGVSSTADAYLTPVLGEYLDGFYKGFQGGREGGLKVEFMGSDGGLLDLKVRDCQWVIISVACAHQLTVTIHCIELFWSQEYLVGSSWRCSWLCADFMGQGPPCPCHWVSLSKHDPDAESLNSRLPMCTLLFASRFDVGGTSTDVSRFDGKYEIVYETTTAGITIQSPQLDINTVAAGGGSCLTFRNGMFCAGPESAGAHPGPACYRKGGPLALTDGNLFLGRLVPR